MNKYTYKIIFLRLFFIIPMHVHLFIEEDKRNYSTRFRFILGGNHTLSSSTNNDKRNDNNNNKKSISQEKLNEQSALMAQLSRTTVSEEYDSDFDDSSDEDSKQLSRTVSINDYDEKEQQQQIIARQQQILVGIVQEWLRKEEFYTEQLKKMEEQVKYLFFSFVLHFLDISFSFS